MVVCGRGLLVLPAVNTAFRQLYLFLECRLYPRSIYLSDGGEFQCSAEADPLLARVLHVVQSTLNICGHLRVGNVQLTIYIWWSEVVFSDHISVFGYTIIRIFPSMCVGQHITYSVFTANTHVLLTAGTDPSSQHVCMLHRVQIFFNWFSALKIGAKKIRIIYVYILIANKTDTLVNCVI